MKKVSDTQAKTPSGTTKTEEILDDISVLVGQISKAEDLCVSNLETISKSLDSKLLEAIVHNTEALVEFSFTQSNMLMGIAGYLLGNKGINPAANVSSLLGKIKNNEPLFVGHTEYIKEYLKELSYLFDSLVSSIKTTTGTDPNNQSSMHSGAVESSGIVSTLNIILKSIDGGNLDSLIELVNTLEKSGNVQNITVLKSIEDLIVELNRIGNLELDNELISKKVDDIEQSIFSMSELFNELSKFERRVSGVDISTITPSISSIYQMLTNMQVLENVSIDLSNISRLPDSIKSLNPLIDELSKLEHIADLAKVNSVIEQFDAKGTTESIVSLAIFINSLATISISKGIDIDKISENINGVKDLIQAYIPTLDAISKVPKAKISGKVNGVIKNANYISELLDAFNNISNSGINNGVSDSFLILSDIIYSLQYVLDSLAYLANDELEENLYTFKEDILPYIYSTDNSDIVSRIANIDFKNFSNNTVKEITQFEMTVDSLGIVLIKLSKMVPRMVLINKMKDHIFASIDILNSIVGNKRKHSLLFFAKSIVEINKKSRSIKTFGSLMNILVDIFRDLSKVGLFASLCIAASVSINGAIDKLNLISQQISSGLNVADIKNSQQIVHSYRLLLDDMKSIFGDVIKVSILSIFIGKGKAISTAIKKLNNILTIIGEINVENIDNNLDTLDKYKDLMKDLLGVFGIVTLLGIASVPALVGGLLLSATLYTIFNILDGALKSIHKFVSNKATKTSIESMKTIIMSISLLMVFASIMGGVVMGYWDNILVFLGMFMTFTLLVLGTITLIGGFVNKRGAKGGIEALSKLSNIIIACTFCMFAGALFMMIPGIWQYVLSFTALFALFVGALLGTFLLVSLIGGKRIQAQMDSFAHILITCAGVLMIGALFMMIPNIWKLAVGFGVLIFVFTNAILAAFLFISKMGGHKIRAQMDEFAKLITVCAGVLIIGALFMMIPAYRENSWIFALTLGVFVAAIVLVIALYSKHAKNSNFVALSLMIFTMVAAATLMYGANFIAENGAENIIIFAAIVAGYTLLMTIAMVILTRAAKNIVIGTICMIALVGITYLFGFALENIAEAYKIFESPGEAFICLGWIAAVLVAFAGAIFGLGALMGTGVGAALFAAGVAALASLGGAVLVVGEAMKSISDGIKSIKTLSQEEDEINVDNITNLITSIKDIAEKFNVLDEIPIKNIKKSSNIVKLISKSISTISEVVKDTASLKIPIYDEAGSISGYRQLKPEDFKLVSDNVGTIVTSLAGALGDAYDNNPKLFKGNRARKVIKAVKGISNILDNIAGGIVALANLEMPKYTEDGTLAGGTTKLDITTITGFGENVNMIVTSFCGALDTAYTENQKLFKGNRAKKVIKAVKGISDILDNIANGIVALSNLEIPKYNSDGTLAGGTTKLEITSVTKLGENVNMIVTSFCGALDTAYTENEELFKGTRVRKVLKALKGVSDVINTFTDAIVKFANSEYPEYDDNGKPTGKKVHINDKIIAQMKGSIETLITAVLGSISEIYAKPETQALFTGKNLKNATDAVKDVSAIIGGLGKDIVDLAGLYIKDENGKVVQMDATHFEKAKQNLKDILTCVLVGVDDLAKDDTFKKFTETGMFGQATWDVAENIKKNLDSVKPLVDSAIENTNAINKAVKLLTPVNDKKGPAKTWADLLSAIFDPLHSFKVEDKDAAKKKKESIKQSLDNARSIIREINTLDEGKADKFIKLSQELKDLSINVGDMSGLIAALNGKINDTLNTVSKKLIETTKALETSDKAQDKRNKLIKENTEELKKVLETPLTVNVKAESESKSKYKGNDATGPEGENVAFDGSITGEDFDKLTSAATDILNILKNHFS